MKSTYINIAFGILVGALSMLPSTGEATSYAYNPGYGNEPISIANNNYNNNNNSNTNTASTVMYSGSYADQARGGVEYIARQNLYNNTYIAPTPVVHKAYTYTSATNTGCTTCAYNNYRMVKTGSCGAAVIVNNTRVPKPTCTLVPAITDSGEIELQWTTNGATVAFIDTGIGHVTTVSGSRIITPKKDTAYNLTVLNDAGIASTCGAKVNVTITDPVDPDPVDPVDPDPVDPTNPDDGGSLFGDTFRTIALPVGIVFLILIVLLVIIMSKVKNSK